MSYIGGWRICNSDGTGNIITVFLANIMIPIPYVVIAICTGIIAYILDYHIKKQKKRAIAIAILSMYTLYVFFSTVVCREISNSYTCNLIPLYSYYRAFSSDILFLSENLLNILLLLPFAVLLEYVIRKKKVVLLCGGLFSLAIEFSQLAFMRGSFEIDDIINNLLGVGLGILLMDKIYEIKLSHRIRKI